MSELNIIAPARWPVGTELSDVALAREVKRVVSQLWGECRCEVVSKTNNIVFRVSPWGRSDSFAVKLVRDQGIDQVSVLAFERAAVLEGLPVCNTLVIDESAHQVPYPFIVQQYVEAPALAEVIGRQPELSGVFATTAEKVIRACARLAPSEPTWFGYLKRNVTTQDSVAAFYSETLKRYADRVSSAACFTPSWFTRTMQQLELRILAACEAHPQTSVVPVDVNMKNFLVLPGPGLLVLNVPLLAFTSCLHAVSSFAFQLRAVGESRSLVARLRSAGLSAAADHEIAAFEALAALGVLSFCAKSGANALLAATAWGSSVRLVDIFLETLADAGLATENAISR